MQENHLEAMDVNYFPRHESLIDYVTGEILRPIEQDILIKNYFVFMVNELDTHVRFYQSALDKNQKLEDLIQDVF